MAGYELNVTIKRGVDLLAMDKGLKPTSDPYVAVSLGDPDQQNHKRLAVTNVITSNINPEWDETFTLFVSQEDYDKSPHLVMRIYDRDRFTADDEMGQAALPLSQVPEETKDWQAK